VALLAVKIPKDRWKAANLEMLDAKLLDSLADFGIISAWARDTRQIAFDVCMNTGTPI
jgi:hypothetical protein